MSMRQFASWRFCLLVCPLLWMVPLGCQYSARSLSLNQPQARDACTAFLTAWKEGKQPADLKPKIIGRDSDWASGKKLESFELLPKEHNDGTNLHLAVRLVLKDDKGHESNQEVIYIVGTSPSVTVFRGGEE